MIRAFFVFLLSLACCIYAPLANATKTGGGTPSPPSYGPYLCGHCDLRDIITDSNGMISAGADLLAFIKGVVNLDVVRWVPGATVTVCDGRVCATAIYHKSGNFIAPTKLKPDPRTDYKNAWKADGAWSAWIPIGIANWGYMMEVIPQGTVTVGPVLPEPPNGECDNP